MKMHNRIKFLDICKKFVHIYNDLMPFYMLSPMPITAIVKFPYCNKFLDPFISPMPSNNHSKIIFLEDSLHDYQIVL